MTILRKFLATTALVCAGTAALAEDVTITVWAGGSNDSDSYRMDAIELAAEMLMRERAIEGEELTITIEKKRDFGGWEEFKQAVTLAAEAGTAPNIVVTSHLDIAPWSQAGLIVPVEDYLDLDAWPLNDIYDNLMEIAAYDGVQWGLPQDAESRPFFFWKDTMKGIGYTDEEIAALPAMVEAGEYTLQNVLADAKKAVDMGLVEEGYGFYPRVSNGPDYAQFYQSFGGVLQDPETGKLVLDKVAMEEMYQFFVDAVAAGVTRKNHIGTDWAQWYSEVANGKAALWHGGTWHYARYTGKEGNTDFFGTIEFSLIPAGNEKGRANTITHPLVYLITDQADDDHEDIAAQLVKIASEPRMNTLHAIKSAHLGISHQQSNIELYSNDRWASEATDRLLGHANAQPNHVQYGVFSEALWKGLEAAWTGVKTPAEAVAEVEAELKAKLGDELIVR
ncbi:ABC transporter substrate-binding protein [Mameliella sediminis]|uniref:ABC transporter substrate-binding protein n=1 Tax=Mameliella sediminis TaxID=2836866 RepID=UPI001C49149F|nr:extracellular solute-binding protein [Mameliella sediminis]MBY6115100.1 extracellular solute-binding protein [Antarctobacter heliothermus]MBY6145015.1 extracellular solute-binding protein [Mameliella alba]MBV7396122.1 extracellular solute-binding protein [Mameliella sediminis]MBY6160533.1 extracellular solute-binding protein [Mameliella alba]MBY6169003.1 extracellular solute-binding protein [Mameliella alba]